MSRKKRPETLEKEIAEVQRYIRQRVALAMGDRSLNWLAEASDVSQSTLHGYQVACKSPYTFEALQAVAKALKRPLPYFLPREGSKDRIWEEKDVAAVTAFYQVAELVDWWRAATPESAAEVRDVADRVRAQMGERPAPRETPDASSPQRPKKGRSPTRTTP